MSMLLDFNRSVDVLWAPDGKAAAITDHRASDESAVLILQLDAPAALIDVEPALIRAFGRLELLYRHGHRYFVAESWVSPTALVFDVRAHDSGPQYRATFVYELAGTVRHVR